MGCRAFIEQKPCLVRHTLRCRVLTRWECTSGSCVGLPPAALFGWCPSLTLRLASRFRSASAAVPPNVRQKFHAIDTIGLSLLM